MLKKISLATQQWGASFANNYLLTQSVAASGAMVIAQPLMQAASGYLRSHCRACQAAKSQRAH